MISEPVFEDRNSLSSLIQRAEARRAAGDRIPDDELATIIERHRGKELPAAITEYLAQHFRGEIKVASGPRRSLKRKRTFGSGPPIIFIAALCQFLNTSQSSRKGRFQSDV